MRRPGRRRNVKVDVHGVFVGQKDTVGGDCRIAGLQDCRITGVCATRVMRDLKTELSSIARDYKVWGR